MKRLLKIVGIAGSLVLLGLIVAVNMIAGGGEPMQAPDSSMLITLPSGESERLDAVLAAYLAPDPGTPATVGASAATAGLEGDEEAGRDPGSDGAAELRQARDLLALRNESLPAPDSGLFSLAEWHRQGGHMEQAEALYASIPEGHPHWSRARRRLAWDVYAKGRGEAARGVPLAHESLRSDPLDGNAWQDAARVYLATVGLSVD